MSYYIVFTAAIPAFRHFIFVFHFVLPSFPFQLRRVPADFQKHTIFFIWALKWSKTLHSPCAFPQPPCPLPAFYLWKI